MKVLVACEYSGKVREAFRKQGHDAWSCDILPADDDSAFHYQGDVLNILYKGWDVLIAHPPCTYLTNAGARHLYPKGQLNQDRLALGLEAKEFFMTLYNAPIEHVCVENPIPSKVYELPPYTQIVQPYEYGHATSKKTCLWLRNLPALKPTDIVDKTTTTRNAGNWFNKGGKNRWKQRSETFQGIANAMAQQWSKTA